MKITDLKVHVLKCALAEPFAFSHPLDIEVLRHRLYHATRDYRRKGSVVSGIGAIDIPSGPGLGVKVDRAVVEESRIGR